MFNPTSPVTGSPISGFTSPTYTLTPDTAQSQNERQWVVSAIGGTQPQVVAHTSDRPFTIRTKRPKVIKTLKPNGYGVGGIPLYGSVPINVYDILVNTRAPIDSSGNLGAIRVRLQIEAAAGIPTYGTNQLAGVLSCLLGAATAQISGLVDNVKLGQN